jgi:hypothetical protein
MLLARRDVLLSALHELWWVMKESLCLVWLVEWISRKLAQR